MPDYSKGKIYTIRCRNDNNLIYVGSTVQTLSKRFGGHKTDSKRHFNYLLYSTINNDWTNWFVELYEEYPCNNKEQLLKREGEVIREIATLNMNIAGRTLQEYLKEYRQANADKIKKYKKEYQQANADKLKEKRKEYCQANADKLKEQKKEYRQANADDVKEYDKLYRNNNADKINEKRRERYEKKKLEKLEKQAISN